MPTVQAIESALFALAPRELAMDWDNVGLLLGDPAAEVSRILLALDVTDAVAAEAKAKGCQLIVSHHPLMNVRWHQREMQTLRPDRRLGRLLTTLVKDDIAVISLHTNLDAAPGGVNDALAAALGLEDPGPLPGDESGICRVGSLKAPMAPADFAAFVGQTLRAGNVRWRGDRPVRKVAVGGGACGDFIPQVLAAGCDTFVTSDLGYHQFLDAAAEGLNLLDAGHFPTENGVLPVLEAYLQARFPALRAERSAVHGDVIRCWKADDPGGLG